MTDGLKMKLMFDVAAFCVLRTKKFSARGKVIKKRTNLDLRSRCFTAVARDVDLAAINDNFGPGDGARFARGQAKSRHTGDAWQSFAAKSECCHGLKISSRPNLARRMPLQRKQRVIAVHAAAVIYDANERNSSATNNDIDVASTGVQTVFDQFLHD